MGLFLEKLNSGTLCRVEISGNSLYWRTLSGETGWHTGLNDMQASHVIQSLRRRGWTQDKKDMSTWYPPPRK